MMSLPNHIFSWPVDVKKPSLDVPLGIISVLVCLGDHVSLRPYVKVGGDLKQFGTAGRWGFF